MNERLSDAKKRMKEIIRILKAKYPHATITLDFGTPFQLLVSTILAAQSTDKKVNEVTETLFKKYPDASAFANANLTELENDIHATGFFRQKSKAIVGTAQDIVSVHDDHVPDTMEELLKLPGVGRKTANVILGNAFGKQALVVDTHVLRISGRLGFVDPKQAEKKDADKVEQALMKVVAEEDWTVFGHLIIHLGRDICTAKKPEHEICPILHLCPTGSLGLTTSAKR